MELSLHRLTSSKDFTIGKLYVNGAFECYTLEDEARTVKVKGETRIPAGRYEVKLQKAGKLHDKYLVKFGETFHVGMLNIADVPNFAGVMFHIGNDDDDTEGCPLVGKRADHVKGYLYESEVAYRQFYAKVAEVLLCGEKVFVTIK